MTPHGLESMRYLGQPDGLGAPLGRYSHVSVADGPGLVAVAGQVGVTPDGELAGDGGLAAQTTQAFANVRLALDAAGVGPGDVLKLTTFLVDAGDIDAFMRARTEVYAEMYPGGEYPPNTLLVVERLVEERLRVEIEALAVRGG